MEINERFNAPFVDHKAIGGRPQFLILTRPLCLCRRLIAMESAEVSLHSVGRQYQVIQSPARRLFRDGFRGGVLGYVQMPLVNIDCSGIFRDVRVVKPIIANASLARSMA